MPIYGALRARIALVAGRGVFNFIEISEISIKISSRVYEISTSFVPLGPYIIDKSSSL